MTTKLASGSSDNELLKKHSASNSLSLIIMPTEQCNFRCVYCFEDFRLNKMAPQIVDGVKNFINRRSSELEHMDISWYGGEPLAACDIILGVMKFVRNTLRSDAQIVGSITTNGSLLTNDRLSALLEVGITNYQITFDGDKDHHDLLRKRMNGDGTFDLIWPNIIGMHKIYGNFETVLRVHVDRENISSVEKLFDRIGTDLEGDSRFRIWIYPLLRLGGPEDNSLPVLEEKEVTISPRDISIVKALEKKAKERGLKLFDQYKLEMCHASKLNSFVIRSDGRLGKCTVALRDERNTVGKLRPDGTLELDQGKILLWGRGLFSGDKDELNCPLIAVVRKSISNGVS